MVEYVYLSNIVRFSIIYVRNITMLRKAIMKYNLYRGKNHLNTNIIGLFTCRAYNVLSKEGISTIEDIVSRFQFKNDMLMLPNLGKKSMKEIVDVLGGYGIKFLP